MIEVIYFIIFLLFVFASFLVLLKTLDLFYLKSLFKTITSLLIIFFVVVFPFVGIYCIAQLFHHETIIQFFETSFLGLKITTFFQNYFMPLYFLFCIGTLIVMTLISLGKIQKQSTKPFKVSDGNDVRNDRLMLKEKQYQIRPLEKNDAEELLTWLTNEEVLERYDGRDCAYTASSIQKRYYNKENISRYILVKGKEKIGYLQYYPLAKTELTKYHFGIESTVYGIDYFIGVPKYFKKSIQEQYLRMICTYLLDHDVDLLVADPLISNRIDIESYEACGFEVYRTLPHHRLHEGKYQDCYLMKCEKVKLKEPRKKKSKKKSQS